jgi:hypothetical protein
MRPYNRSTMQPQPCLHLVSVLDFNRFVLILPFAFSLA